MYTSLNLYFFASDASWPGTSTFNWNVKVSVCDRMDWPCIHYLPGSCGVLLSEASVNREAQKGIGNFHFFDHIRTAFCSAMNDPCDLRINPNSGGHKNLITIRPVWFQERNHFILVCKINLDEFIIGSWVCKAFDIVVVLLEGLEYCRSQESRSPCNANDIRELSTQGLTENRPVTTIFILPQWLKGLNKRSGSIVFAALCTNWTDCVHPQTRILTGDYTCF